MHPGVVLWIPAASLILPVKFCQILLNHGHQQIYFDYYLWHQLSGHVKAFMNAAFNYDMLIIEKRCAVMQHLIGVLQLMKFVCITEPSIAWVYHQLRFLKLWKIVCFPAEGLLISVFPFVCLCVWKKSNTTERLSWNFLLPSCVKIYRHIWILLKIGHRYQAFWWCEWVQNSQLGNFLTAHKGHRSHCGERYP